MFEVALSPCPNDTFLFHAWLTGLVAQELPPTPTFGDIQSLNEWALAGKFPLIKLSFNCYAKLEERYDLLPVGSALGFNCGPKIISKKPFPLEELSEKTLAIPGKETTAHLLQQIFTPEPRYKRFCFYHEIADLIERGEADCGLIIHESRFTFQHTGFVEIVDLGEVWHQKTSLPLPLGGLALHKEVPRETRETLIEILRNSLHYAWAHPEKSRSFILEHSQEKDPQVVAEHIATYVNKETDQLSKEGYAAIETLSHFCRSLRSAGHPCPL